MKSHPDLAAVLSKDRFFLERTLSRPQKQNDNEFQKAEERLQKSHEAWECRKNHLPAVTYDGTLPVHERRDDIRTALLAHQVIIVCGETGSGKTTQLPKICLEAGRGIAGLIGHTQPRRLAARAVAERLAEELDSSIGAAVGYKVRFNDKTAPDSYIKLMTDGILLAETQTDRFLTAYDTIIIDEAHERSLNIDFLLGYLKLLLPKRPDLKIIITSATIDAQRFQKHFGAEGETVPVIEVSGRTYPVEVRYRPVVTENKDEADEYSVEDAVADAADELAKEGSGDILVFLPGEREIRETATALRRSLLRKDDEILPLFARLSAGEQHKIFHPSSGRRRIILATNIAETSLTVPGIRYVIDTGEARVKRYSANAKVEQLQIEKISRAAAQQRSGRCGRVAAGICIRLYDEADFDSRPAYTDPEILRSNLAAVILRMMALKLGDIADFPFPEAPNGRYISDGRQILWELGAADEKNRITALGKKMARLPLDPKISRMLLAAADYRCLSEILVIAAALSVQDPRERPLQAREAADKTHERFTDKKSDFLTFLNIWDSYQKERDKGLSGRQADRWLSSCFLSPNRMREWRELHRQLCQTAGEMNLALKAALVRKIPVSAPDIASDDTADRDPHAQALQKQKQKDNNRQQRRDEKEAGYDKIHRALLTGLIANIGNKNREGHDYQGARGGRFHIFPASGLFKSKPKWVMAAELTETAKVYAGKVAQIEPQWVEEEAPHLVRSHYAEPHWSQKRGEVVASERVTLYGLTVVSGRQVAYASVDADTAYELFVRGALVAGDADIRADFFRHNRKLMADVEALEHKSRRQDVLVDEEALFAFYSSKIPQTVSAADGKTLIMADIRTFEYWRRQAEKDNPKLLFLQRDDLMQHGAGDVTEMQFPTHLQTADGKFKLSYRFEPGHPSDGVTVNLPLAILNRMDAAVLEWLVPGMIREKIQLVIKALPKQIRRICVPVPDFITQFLSSNPDRNAPLLPQLYLAVGRTAGNVAVTDSLKDSSWSDLALPPHCFFNIRVTDDGGQELASGRNLHTLQQELGHAAAVTFRDSGHEMERDNITVWDIGTLPESIRHARGKRQLTAFPAIEKQQDGTLSLRLFDTAQSAAEAHRTGVTALMALQMKEQVKDLNKGLPDFTRIAMLLKHLGADNLRADIAAAVCDRAFIGDDPLPHDEKSFREQLKKARARLPSVKEALNRMLLQTAEAYAALKRLPGRHPIDDALFAHADRLVHAGFVSETLWPQWPRLPVYLQAIERRREKYNSNPGRDAAHAESINTLWQLWADKTADLQRQGLPVPPDMAAFRWMLEELHVSLFAQELKTPYPVSAKRLMAHWQKVT